MKITLSHEKTLFLFSFYDSKNESHSSVTIGFLTEGAGFCPHPVIVIKPAFKNRTSVITLHRVILPCRVCNTACKGDTDEITISSYPVSCRDLRTPYRRMYTDTGPPSQHRNRQPCQPPSHLIPYRLPTRPWEKSLWMPRG